jgi:beta-hydroxylase
MTLLLGFTVGSLTYVFRYRGVTRYRNLTEYLRKGWPVFAPINCLLYLFTQKRAGQPLPKISDFPELKAIEDNWEMIRDEAAELYQQGIIQATANPDSASYYDVGFRTFYKYGWRKFYLRWYGHTINSAQKYCPQTVKLLESIPSVNGAMFSVLPAGSQLTRHLDPFAMSLRYHLGLITPNDDKCFINIDSQSYSWRDGKGFIFDETYLHYAKNDSDQYRLILMCDIERPLWGLGSLINFCYKSIARLMVVPNMEGDKRGFFNRLFAAVTPLLNKGKTLKASNLKLYLTIKYALNITLIVIFMALLASIIQLLLALFGWA